MFIYYQILGLDENAKDQEIRNRYLELVRKFTPEQHPEGFIRITKAYEALTVEVTDDAAAVELLGYKVKLYPGTYHNIKVTTPVDLALAEVIASDAESGYRL